MSQQTATSLCGDSPLFSCPSPCCSDQIAQPSMGAYAIQTLSCFWPLGSCHRVSQQHQPLSLPESLSSLVTFFFWHCTLSVATQRPEVGGPFSWLWPPSMGVHGVTGARPRISFFSRGAGSRARSDAIGRVCQAPAFRGPWWPKGKPPWRHGVASA